MQPSILDLVPRLVSESRRDLAWMVARRSLQYRVRARAFDSLGDFASMVIFGTDEPAMLGQVVADLQALASEVPSGRARWQLWANLADALRQTHRLDQALSLYARAAEEAEAAEHWSDLGWILRGLGRCPLPRRETSIAPETCAYGACR